MCGLVGVAGDLVGKDLDVYRDLLYASERRGADATGMAIYNQRKKEYLIAKAAMPSGMFLDVRRHEAMISAQHDVLMGHTRKATYANKHSNSDAHPFHHGNIIGAHNGSIQWEGLNKLKHRIPGAIDSEDVIYNISKEGIDGTIPNLFGAWALSLLDIENAKLGFVRNAQRPLAFSFSKDKKRLFWASEAPMLHWILWRNGIDTYTDYPVAVKEDIFYEFDLSSGKPIGDSITESMLKGAPEPEKKSWNNGGGYTYVPQNKALSVIPPKNGHNTTSGKSKKETDSYEALMRRIAGLEENLVKFDYSRQHAWSKNQRGRFKAMLMQVEAAHATLQKKWETGEAEEWDDASPNFLKNVDMYAEVFKEMYRESGCAYCMDNDADSVDLSRCNHSKSGDILCPNCSKDETIRALSGLPKLTEEELTLLAKQEVTTEC